MINFKLFLISSVPNLLKRLLRINIFKRLSISKYNVIVIKKKILIVNHSKKIFETPVKRGSRPLKDGVEIVLPFLYYGEYWQNPERRPVFLYQVNLGTGVQTIFHEFSHIRHIHFVQQDKFDSNYLLVGTGDLNYESGIYRINIKTKDIEVIGEGSQTYRAVSIIQTKDYLFWGSDDPDGNNFIYRYNKSNGKLNKLHKLEGPAYYSATDKKERMYMATTIEDRKRHRAIIYRSTDNGENWEQYKEFKKDIWHTKYFGYGLIEFAENQKELEELSYKLTGLKEIK